MQNNQQCTLKRKQNINVKFKIKYVFFTEVSLIYTLCYHLPVPRTRHCVLMFDVKKDGGSVLKKKFKNRVVKIFSLLNRFTDR